MEVMVYDGRSIGIGVGIGILARGNISNGWRVCARGRTWI